MFDTSSFLKLSVAFEKKKVPCKLFTVYKHTLATYMKDAFCYCTGKQKDLIKKSQESEKTARAQLEDIQQKMKVSL